MNTRSVPFLCLIVLSLLCILLNMVGPDEVEAITNDLFVSPDGSGSACSQSLPCQPNQALINAVDYDEIFFKGGTYQGMTDPLLTITKSISLYGGWDGTPSGNVIIDPVTYPAILDGQDTRALVEINDVDPVYTITINGLTFINGNAKETGAYQSGGAIYVDEGQVLIENNIFDSNTASVNGGAIYVSSSLDASIVGNSFIDNIVEYGGGSIFVHLSDPINATVTVEGNSFTGGDAGFGTAVAVEDSGILFTNNLVNDSLGISAADFSSSGPSSTICNNFILHSSQNGLDLGGITDTPYQIINNTIAYANNGIIIYSGVKTNIVNNIIVETSTSIKSFGGVINGNHNLFYYNSVDGYLIDIPDSPVIGQNPLFVDPALDDYHIQPGSPAQDAGTSVPLTFDFDYESRPNGIGFDIGADEIMAGSTVFLPLIVR